MNDVVNAVIKQLKTDTSLWNSRVYEGYPPQFNILPVVSVYLITNRDIGQGDGKGLQFFKSSVSVDVWTKDREFEIEQKVISLVYAINGFVKLTALNVLPEEGGMKHINFAFDIKI